MRRRGRHGVPVRLLVLPVLAGAVALGGCGSLTEDPGAAPAPAGSLPPPCAEVGMLRADDAAYRDGPVYGNAEDLVAEVHGWASGQTGFVELGLDRERNGWVTVWVKDADVAALRQEVARTWPGEGVVVVEVPWTSGELETVRDEVDAALRAAGVRSAGSAVSPHHGVAEIHLGVMTAEAERVLAGFADRPVCVDAIPAQDAPEEKEQPTAGPGWRLLGEAEAGQVYRTSVATTDEQLGRVWREAGLDGGPPQVDWAQEVVVWFGATYGSGCPVRLDGVVVVNDLLHADLVVPGAVYGCNEDARPHAFVLAVSRDVLPDGPFRVQLGPEEPHGGAPEERTLVAVPLTAPGSTATDEQVTLDPSLAQPGEPRLVEDGDPLPDEAVRYAYREREDCATPVLGPLDGSVWRLADREAPWDVADGEELMLLPLGGSEEEIVVSAPAGDWTFRRMAAGTCP